MKITKYNYKLLIFIFFYLFISGNVHSATNHSILLNAEPFGFGPSSIISQIADKLKQYCSNIGYIGEGHTLELQQKNNYQHIIQVPQQASDTVIREKLKELRKHYDYFFTASDFKYARIAKEEGYIVGIYDPLIWFWKQLPDTIHDSDIYIAQNFVGVKERLQQLNVSPQKTYIIPSLTPKITTITTKSNNLQQAFINLGGLSNPFITNNILSDFTKVIGNNLTTVLPQQFNKFQFATSKQFIDYIPPLLNPKTLTFNEIIKNLQNANVNLMTPGLGNIFEAASVKAPVIWLMPMNDSQGQQLKLLEREQLIDWSIDWHDITSEPPIDYFQPQAEVMQQISKNIISFINNPKYQDNFRTILQQKLVSATNYQTNTKLKLPNVITKFGNNGIVDLTSILLSWLKITPNKKELSKDKKVAFSTCWKIGGDITIKFESDVPFVWNEKNTVEFNAHIPGFKQCEDNTAVDFVIRHHFTEAKTVYLQQQDNSIDIFSCWQQQLPADFLHMLYGICRKLWLKKNIYPVHGALIKTAKQDYSLIVGSPGVGKTSLALCLYQQGCQIFSGDKTLIKIDNNGKMYAIAGTKTITIRKQDESKWQNLQYDKQYKNNERLLVKLDTDNSNEAVVKSIYLINLNDGVYYHQVVNQPSALHTLYPFFLDKQREDILIGEDQAILDGNVDILIRKQLSTSLKYSLTIVPTYKIIGTRSQLAKIITNNQQQQKQPIISTDTKKILFGICGIGNGHINRQLPLIKDLLQANHEIIIFTYGTGLTSFNNLLAKYNNLQVVEVANPYIVGNKNGLDFLQSINNKANLGVDFFTTNALAMNKVLQQFNKPDIVISDYEAVSAQYAYAKNCQLVTIDQQSKYLVGNFPKNINGTFYQDEIERLSMFFPVAKQRIALSFFQVDKKNNSNHQVTILPPILKNEISQAKNKQLTKEPSLLVYMSNQQMCDFSVQEWADVLSEAMPKNFIAHFFIPKTQNIPQKYKNINFYHHGDKAFNEILFSCHGIISTAGHSLLSEAMYLEKPVYAIPINLYEQQLNAHMIAIGGFGIADQTLDKNQLAIFIENLAIYRKNIQNDNTFLLKLDNNKHPLIPLIQQLLTKVK